LGDQLSEKNNSGEKKDDTQFCQGGTRSKRTSGGGVDLEWAAKKTQARSSKYSATRDWD